MIKKKDEKDQKIIQAAQKEFLSKGPGGASMESIARLAGVSKRTLYKYYPSKEELFNHLINLLFENVSQTLKYPTDSDTPLEILLEQIIDSKISLVNDEDFLKLAKIIFFEQSKNNFFQQDIWKRFSTLQRNFQEWLIHCQRKKLIGPTYNEEQLALYLNSLVEGFFIWPYFLGVKRNYNPSELSKIKAMIKNGFLALTK